MSKWLRWIRHAITRVSNLVDPYRDRAVIHAELAGLSGWSIFAGATLVLHSLYPHQLFDLVQGISQLNWAANLLTGLGWLVGGVMSLIGMLRPGDYISTSWMVERFGWINVGCASLAYAVGTLVMEPDAVLSWSLGFTLVWVAANRLAYLVTREKSVRQDIDYARRAKRIASSDRLGGDGV